MTLHPPVLYILRVNFWKMPIHLVRITMKQNYTQEVYQIRVQGRLDSNWSAWFDDMTLAFENGVTTISGVVADQAALHGLLAKVRDLGLTLIDVHRVEAENKQE